MYTMSTPLYFCQAHYYGKTMLVSVLLKFIHTHYMYGCGILRCCDPRCHWLCGAVLPSVVKLATVIVVAGAEASLTRSVISTETRPINCVVIHSQWVYNLLSNTCTLSIRASCESWRCQVCCCSCYQACNFTVNTSL